MFKKKFSYFYTFNLAFYVIYKYTYYESYCMSMKHNGYKALDMIEMYLGQSCDAIT